jgi:hypothetical protein
MRRRPLRPRMSFLARLEWAGRHDIPITPGLAPVHGLREDIIRYCARYLAQHGDTIKSLRRLAED